VAGRDHLGRLIDHSPSSFALDPDENDIEAAHHGRGSRSAPSVMIAIANHE
jgi:hypothetical protein